MPPHTEFPKQLNGQSRHCNQSLSPGRTDLSVSPHSYGGTVSCRKLFQRDVMEFELKKRLPIHDEVSSSEGSSGSREHPACRGLDFSECACERRPENSACKNDG